MSSIKSAINFYFQIHIDILIIIAYGFRVEPCDSPATISPEH